MCFSMQTTGSSAPIDKDDEKDLSLTAYENATIQAFGMGVPFCHTCCAEDVGNDREVIVGEDAAAW